MCSLSTWSLKLYSSLEFSYRLTFKFGALVFPVALVSQCLVPLQNSRGSYFAKHDTYFDLINSSTDGWPYYACN
jgi:hypothetical protein